VGISMKQQKNSSDLHGKLKTTIVDSFPLDKTLTNMKQIFNDQISLGIDFPMVPQLQDMSLMFLDPLAEQNCGIEIQNGITQVIGDLIPPSESFILPELIWTKSHLKSSGFQDKIDGIKIYITGPFTLAYFIRIADMPALLMPDIVEKLAHIIKKIVYDIDKEEVAIITIYEHILNFAIAQFAIEEDFALKCLNTVFKGISKAVSALHVCDDIFSVAKLLLQLDNVVYLGHDFVSSPENLMAYKKKDLEKYDKMIGYGCLASVLDPLLLAEIRRGNTPWQEAVESEKEINTRIMKAIDRYGVENLVINPDCSFGNLKHAIESKIAYSIMKAKLKNMVAATKAIRKDLQLNVP
jgi:5-methyltetrahydropteroyltriglutamate--homocysteine methyltransferase